MKSLTTAEKIAAIEYSGKRLAFDGCHKLYLIENEGDVATAQNCGYESEDIFPASQVRELIQKSCFLVFVHPMSLEDEHPLDILQGELDPSAPDLIAVDA